MHQASWVADSSAGKEGRFLEAGVGCVRNHAEPGKGILRGGSSDLLDAWVDDAIETDLIPIMRFARVLRRDIDAVYNAIELPWSNGQVEGQVDRPKTIKRAMYGRAGPELLRARMLSLRHMK